MKKVAKNKVFKTPVKKVAKKSTKKLVKKAVERVEDITGRTVLIAVKVPKDIPLNDSIIIKLMEDKILALYDRKHSLNIENIRVRTVGVIKLFVCEIFYDGDLDQEDIDFREFLWNFENYPKNGINYETGKRKSIPSKDYIDIGKIYESVGEDTRTFGERLRYFINAFKYLFFK